MLQTAYGMPRRRRYGAGAASLLSQSKCDVPQSEIGRSSPGDWKMSLWHRIAVEHMPERKRIIDKAENPLMMWSELPLELERASEGQVPNDEPIRGIYKYALWSVARLRSNHASTDIACCCCMHVSQEHPTR